MLIAFTGFSLWAVSDVFVHAMADYPMPLMIFCSAVSSLLFLTILSPWLGGFQETFRRPKLKLRMFRGAVLVCSNILAFYAFAHLDLTKAYALVFISPLLAKVMSVFLLKEKISTKSWIISITGFAGVLVVLRPGWVEIDLASMAAVGLTLFFAFGYVLARYIGDENQTPLSLALFQYCFLILLLAYPAWNAYHTTPVPLTPLLYTLAIGSTSAMGSVLVAQSFARAPSAYIAPIHYTQILWGTFWGALLYNEFPDIWTGVGAAIIIGAGLMLISTTSRAKT